MPDSVRTAQAFLNHLHAGEYSIAMEVFAPAMRAAVTDVGLAQTWERIKQIYGTPVRHSATRTSRTLTAEADIVYLCWDFEKERLDTRITISNANQIVGLSFEIPVIR
jgi:hypothetical protein